MTPEEAVERAKTKIRSGKLLDEMDVANIVVSVHADGYRAGFESAYREMATLCAKHLPKTDEEEIR